MWNQSSTLYDLFSSLLFQYISRGDAGIIIFMQGLLGTRGFTSPHTPPQFWGYRVGYKLKNLCQVSWCFSSSTLKNFFFQGTKLDSIFRILNFYSVSPLGRSSPVVAVMCNTDGLKKKKKTIRYYCCLATPVSIQYSRGCLPLTPLVSGSEYITTSQNAELGTCRRGI